MIGLFAAVAGDSQAFVSQALATTNGCENSTALSYDQAVDELARGGLKIIREPDLAANRVTVTVTNDTLCSVSVSLSSYKMYGPYSLSSQSTQTFFDGTQTMAVGPSSTVTLNVSLPTCAAQYDIWYGDALHTLIDNQPYGNLLAGDQVAQSVFCASPVQPPVLVPITATISADSACVIPGRNIVFTSTASGDGIISKTLEKDTNGDGVYGQVADLGAGQSTNTFTSSEGPSYSGIYSLRLMVNGIEKARSDVTVNASCGPVVVIIPPIVTPPVTPLVVVTPPAVVIPPPAIVIPPPAVVIPSIVTPLVVVTPPAVVIPPPDVVVPPVTPPVILAIETPPSTSLGGGGGPVIQITKSPEPASLPAGPGLVTYTYTVWNEGSTFDLVDVTVVDDKCGIPTFVSGDTNNNNKLDTRERWIYTCTSRLTTTTTNTAVAVGYNDGPTHQSVTATAVATVTVGTPVAAVQTSLSPFSPDFPSTGFAPRWSK